MDRVAMFVDAGYLLTACALAASGAVVKRRDVLLDAAAATALCRSLAAAAAPDAQLLRVYWYDAAVRSDLTAEHRSVSREPGCRLRLGSVSAAGVQKGVDTAIVRDLGTLARHRAVGDVVLIMGDEDLHTGLDEAQEWGVRVHLAAVFRERVLAAVALQWDADSVIPITADQLAGCIRVRPSARPGADADFLGSLGASREPGLAEHMERPSRLDAEPVESPAGAPAKDLDVPLGAPEAPVPTADVLPSIAAPVEAAAPPQAPAPDMPLDISHADRLRS